MDIILSKGDQDYIDAINKSIERNDGLLHGIGSIGTRYYIEFEITDVGKSTAFISSLLGHAHVSMLDEVCGVKANCLRFPSSQNGHSTRAEMFQQELKYMKQERT